VSSPDHCALESGLKDSPGWFGRCHGPTIVRVLSLMAAVYVFLLSVKLMGTSFKLVFPKEQAETVLRTAVGNPLVALMAGVLCTAIVQSSSFVTSVTVGMVASGALSVTQAVPIVMGANIGTTVTNTLVSLGHITRKDEFRRACGGAIIHDIFNLLTVMVLFPLQVATNFLSVSAEWLGDRLFGAQTIYLPNPLSYIVKPVSNALKHFVTKGLHLSNGVAGTVLAVAALVALFAALFAIVKLLRSLVLKRLEGMFDRVLFRNAPTALTVGLLMTMLVQSSSVTTSLMVPLVGAGVLTMAQVYPYTLGANVGTTATALLAALATGSKAGLVCATTHLLFNVSGIIIFYPLRVIPLSLAKGLANHFAEKRHRAVIHVAVVFFVIPGAILFGPRIARWIRGLF